MWIVQYINEVTEKKTVNFYKFGVHRIQFESTVEMGLSASKAGRDVVHRENHTHVELNTRHVIAKTGGWRLFDIHAEGSGGSGGKDPLEGATQIGLIGEIALIILFVAIVIWAMKKCLACRIRHDSYKQWYRAQTISAPFAPRVPPPSEARAPDVYYGPNPRALERYQKDVRLSSSSEDSPPPPRTPSKGVKKLESVYDRK